MMSFLNTSDMVQREKSVEKIEKTDSYENLTLEDVYKLIKSCKENKSLVKKYLTKEIVEMYKNTKTSKNGTLAMCIRTNITNPQANLCRCTDIECYDVFRNYFHPIIMDFHKIATSVVYHPLPYFGSLNNLFEEDLDPTRKYILSTRIRIARTVEDFPFTSIITKEERLELEKQIAASFSQLSGEFSGHYYPLLTMNRHTFDKLVVDHFLFMDGNSILRDAGGYRDWPSGRGVFLNNLKNFIAWVNEKDHIRIISIEHGGNLSTVYSRLVNGVHLLEENLHFVRHNMYGYLTFCPSNLGTAMNASVFAKIPLVSRLPNFKNICQKYQLHAVGKSDEYNIDIDDVYSLGNQRLLGLTEQETIIEMSYGIREIIALEVMMEGYNVNLLKGLMAVEPLEYLINLLNIPENMSLTKKYLTKDIVNKYAHIKTSKGSTLSHCVRNCAYNYRALCPRTGDAECYDVFKEYFNRIIMDYHGVVDSDFHHPSVQFGDIYQLPFSDLDSTGQYVISTRIRLGRSVKGFNFPTTIDKAQRLRLENIISETLINLTGELAGKYYPLTGMDSKVQKQLIEDHFLFKDDDPVLRDAGGYRDWPSGRGIFHNSDKTFLVWVCEEDHIRIISMQSGGDVAQVYRRLVEGVRAIEDKVPFVYSNKFGYLTCCPSNLGTTMRASVHLKVPKLSSDKIRFDEICKSFNVQARGFHGEHTESVEGIYDISNRRRLGLTELEAATEMATAVHAIINIEMSL